MACDLQSQGITVSLLHPGIVRTGLDPDSTAEPHPESVEPEEAASKLVSTVTLSAQPLIECGLRSIVGGVSKQNN